MIIAALRPIARDRVFRARRAGGVLLSYGLGGVLRMELGGSAMTPQVLDRRGKDVGTCWFKIK